MSLKKNIAGYVRSLKQLRTTRLDLNKYKAECLGISDRLTVAESLIHEISSKKIETGNLKGPNIDQLKVLISDDLHISRKNFPPLYGLFDQEKVSYKVAIPVKSESRAFVSSFGECIKFASLHPTYIFAASAIDFSNITTTQHRGINLFRVAKDEAVAACLDDPIWEEILYKQNDDDLANILLSRHKRMLVNCLARAMYWIDYWSDTKFLEYDVAITFSGSPIYSRSLLEVISRTKVRTFVVESFLTGNDFYLEERITPIANNSKIRSSNVYNSLRLNSDSYEYSTSCVNALNAYFGSKNKNVTQPPAQPLPSRLRDRKTILIVGQVFNDYSLVSGCGNILSSIGAYKKLVLGLLRKNKDCFVLFKAHPWERNKHSVREPFTASRLQEWSQSLPNEMRDRFVIVDEFNLPALFKVSDAVATLCSQAGIESALAGFKPVVIGGAYYDNAGFTSNFNNIDDAVDFILEDEQQLMLSLSEFDNFMAFSSTFVGRHLVPCNASQENVQRIYHQLKSTKHPGLAPRSRSELSVSPTWTDLIRADENIIVNQDS